MKIISEAIILAWLVKIKLNWNDACVISKENKVNCLCKKKKRWEKRKICTINRKSFQQKLFQGVDLVPRINWFRFIETLSFIPVVIWMFTSVVYLMGIHWLVYEGKTLSNISKRWFTPKSLSHIKCSLHSLLLVSPKNSVTQNSCFIAIHSTFSNHSCQTCIKCLLESL